jgi:hypothetical protein
MKICLSLGLGLALFGIGCDQKPSVAVAPVAPAAAPSPVAPVAPVVPAPPPAPIAPVVVPAPATATPSAAVVTPAVAPTVPPVPTPPAVPAAESNGRKALNALQRIAEAVESPTSPAAAPSAAPSATAPLALADLSTDQVTRGLKEALGKGLDHAVGSLGKTGGFLTNLNVRIPIPPALQSVEKTLRSLGQDRLADEFLTTMNQAAEQAVPAAAEVFKGSLQRLTVADAKRILGGATNAATLYFREQTQVELSQKFLPIVQQATAKSGATAAYKQLLDKAKVAGPFLRTPAVDLDAYVTEKATDGLFKLVAEEELRIRQTSVARSSDLLKSVFGALQR